MSASASAYTHRTPSPGSGPGTPGPVGKLALPSWTGSAEVQRLEHGPRLQGNGLVGRLPPAPRLPLPEGTLLGAQQELGPAPAAPTPLYFDLSSGKITR